MCIYDFEKIDHIYNIYPKYVWTFNAYMKKMYLQTNILSLSKFWDEIVWDVTPWPTFKKKTLSDPVY